MSSASRSRGSHHATRRRSNRKVYRSRKLAKHEQRSEWSRRQGRWDEWLIRRATGLK
jgi:hypothetical protein